MNSGISSSQLSPGTASGASWCQPILGDTLRGGSTVGGPSRRSTSASGSATATRKTTSGRQPRTPRPIRTLQTFASVKRGVRDCLQLVEEEITRLRNEESESFCQSRLVEIEKLTKQAERQKKRLEFHLFKIEEIEESYVLHQQLREGVETMAKAYSLHKGSNKRVSMQNVERGHKECLLTLCALESQLESLLGTLQCSMAGLAGFARLVPGDTCEMVLRYGLQKWKCRGKIGDRCQTWEPKTVSFKALVGDVFAIKVLEVKSLGKNSNIGEKNCETKDMFTPQPQAHCFTLNAAGSVKLTLITHWLPLDGADEGIVSYDIQRRSLGTPRRQAPVMSMIEGDSQQFLYWQKQNYTESDSLSNLSRLSAPIFSSSYHSEPPLVTVVSDSGQLSSQHYKSNAVRSVEGQDERFLQQHARLRPHSMCVQTLHSGSSSFASDTTSESLTRRRRSMSMESLSPRLLQRSSTSLESVVSELQTTLGEVKEQFPQLVVLANLVDQLAELIRTNANSFSARRESNESNSIETVLEAFSFLETGDYECEGLERGSAADEPLIFDVSLDENAHRIHRDLGVNFTMTTTDSGIGSIANRAPRERKSRSDARLFGSCGLTELPMVSVADQNKDSVTGIGQLDVALHWHVTFCNALVKSLQHTELQYGNSSPILFELEQQATAFDQLLGIAAAKEIHFDKLPCVVSSSGSFVVFWRRFCDQSLCCVDTSFTSELARLCAKTLTVKHTAVHADTVLQELWTRLVGSKLCTRINDDDNEETIFLSTTITLHRFLSFFNNCGHTKIEDYLEHVATECEKKTALLPDIIRKHND